MSIFGQDESIDAPAVSAIASGLSRQRLEEGKGRWGIGLDSVQKAGSEGE